MERLYIKSLLLLLAFSCVGLSSGLYATKVARLSIAELMDGTQVVAVVEIAATEITDKPYRQLHTSTESKLIAHTAKVIDSVKGKIASETLSFLHMTGLKAGQQYLVFLSNSNDNEPIVSYGQYGAMTISVISMKSGVLQGIRIPESFLLLPKTIMTEPGVSEKNEQASYVWVNANDFIKFLKKSQIVY